MNLYKLTNKIGDYYVVAPNETKARECLETALDSADYGFSGQRIVTNIELVAEQIKQFAGKPNFSGDIMKVLFSDRFEPNYLV